MCYFYILKKADNMASPITWYSNIVYSDQVVIRLENISPSLRTNSTREVLQNLSGKEDLNKGDNNQGDIKGF